MPEVARELARAKLTLSLSVVGRRDDGYHLIEAEMLSLDLADSLEIGPGADLRIMDEIAWAGCTPARPGDTRPTISIPADDSNLVRRALRAAGRAASVRLTKRIPPGAGLGGGSADAAAILRWAGADSVEVAAALGADVVFCLQGGRAHVSGVGERIKPLPFEPVSLVVVTPPIELSSAKVYTAWDELGGPSGDNGNDLEPAALLLEPRMAWWHRLVSEVSGHDARLAGSGSSWFVECSTPAEALDLEAKLVAAVVSSGERALVKACQAVPGHT